MTYVATYLLIGLGFGFFLSWLDSKIEDPELDFQESKHFNMIMSILFWPWGVYYMCQGMKQS